MKKLLPYIIVALVGIGTGVWVGYVMGRRAQDGDDEDTPKTKDKSEPSNTQR